MLGNKLLTLALAALVLPACSTGPIDATFNYELTEFEDLTIPWRGCQIDATTGLQQNPNCAVSDPVIFRLDARVRDANSLVPANNIRTWFTSPYNDIYLFPQEVLEAIQVPSGGDWDQVIDRGEIWAEFSGRFDGNYRPNYHEGWTDRRGVASVWVWVNSMPRQETGAATQTELHVSIASDTAIVRLQSAN
jgi:hypothetical protein